MVVQWAQPALPLRPFVHLYWWVDYDSAPGEVTPYMPGPALAWIFGDTAGARAQMGGRVTHQPRAFVKGMLGECCSVEAVGRTRNLGVAFAAGAAGVFHDAPVGALEGHLIDLEALSQADVRELAQQIDPARPFPELVEHLDRWLLKRLERHRQPPVARRLAAAVFTQRIWDLPTLTERSGFSSRQLRRVFHREMGIAPKQFLRIARIRAAARMVRTGDAPLSDVAYAHGYFDQAHFSHEFRALLGRTPTEFRAGTPGLAGHFE